jgi:hypothetical protein
LAPVAATATKPPAQLLAAVLAAGDAQRSVHYVTTASYGGADIRQVGDAGITRGIQRMAFRKGARTGHVTVIVAAHTAYVRGDAFTLVNYMGFKSAPAAKYADRWVSIPPTDADYSTVAAAVTLHSTLHQLKLSAALSTTPQTTLDGQQVVGIKGRYTGAGGRTASAILYVRATGSPLPVQETVRVGAARFAVTFSNWNQSMSVSAPTGAVPIATTGLE